MRLIERESQLDALHQYSREASQGQGRLVLLSGEAGVGKSALLQDLAQALSDARWLWAGCDGLFTPAALGASLLDIANQIDGELLRLCRAEAKRDQLYGARCCDNLATYKLSPSLSSRMCTGPTRQRWIC
jgi:Mrp family chromosome partitioning ATPase